VKLHVLLVLVCSHVLQYVHAQLMLHLWLTPQCSDVLWYGMVFFVVHPADNIRKQYLQCAVAWHAQQGAASLRIEGQS
jgi:hypothetical protein